MFQNLYVIGAPDKPCGEGAPTFIWGEQGTDTVHRRICVFYQCDERYLSPVHSCFKQRYPDE